MTAQIQPTAHAEITAPISADLRRIDDAGAKSAPALQPEALRIAMHLRQRAQLSRPGDLDTLSAAGANELERQHAELSAAQSEAKHWRTNHDNVVARLRIFTQRPDIPKELADRLPWYRELVRLQEVEAQAARSAAPLPAVELVGIKDGQETSLGPIAMPPSMHARELLRTHGFGDFEDDMSQDAIALAAMQSLIEYCQLYYAAPAALQAAPPAPAAVAVPSPAHNCCNSWFMSLSEGRQEALRYDKWKLARAAFAAGRAALAAAPAQAVPSGMWTIWESLPGYLIDHCEGEIISEEGLQRALVAMLENPQYSTPPAVPAQEHATQLAGQGQWKDQGYLSEAHYAADMQAVGEALMETITSNYASLQAAGWDRPMDSPAEIVVDLLNLLDEAKVAPAQAQEDARNLETEVLRACRDLPQGWEIEIHLERGYGVVTVIDPQGNDDELPVEGTLFDALKETIDTAIRDDAARAAQGGA